MRFIQGIKLTLNFRKFTYFLGIQIILTGCFLNVSCSGSRTTKIHKPVSHNKPYNPKKNKSSKRVKKVKMKL